MYYVCLFLKLIPLGFLSMVWSQIFVRNDSQTFYSLITGEIVINLSRSTDQVDRPYIMLSVSKVCLDVALMQYGPAVQLSISQALLTDKQHHSSTGQYLELLTSSGELFNLLYRKVS